MKIVVEFPHFVRKIDIQPSKAAHLFLTLLSIARGSSGLFLNRLLKTRVILPIKINCPETWSEKALSPINKTCCFYVWRINKFGLIEAVLCFNRRRLIFGAEVQVFYIPWLSKSVKMLQCVFERFDDPFREIKIMIYIKNTVFYFRIFCVFF